MFYQVFAYIVDGCLLYIFLGKYLREELIP